MCKEPEDLEIKCYKFIAIKDLYNNDIQLTKKDEIYDIHFYNTGFILLKLTDNEFYTNVYLNESDIQEYFITLSEWREKQIDYILEN